MKKLPVVLSKIFKLLAFSTHEPILQPKLAYINMPETSTTNHVPVSAKYCATCDASCAELLLIKLGNKAVKNKISFGLLIPTKKPLRNKEEIDSLLRFTLFSPNPSE